MPSLNAFLCLVSEPPFAPLRQAVPLARAFDATLHVLPTGSASAIAIEQALQTVTEDTPGDGPETRLAPPTDGPLVEHVQEYVSANQVSLVVTDTPSDRGPVPPLAASTTKALVESLECSLFVVGHNADPASIRRLLIPTDLSANAPVVLNCAAELASAYDAAVDLLHVIETVPYVALTPVDRLSLSNTSVPEHRARRRLSALLDESNLSTSAVDLHFEYGDPADQIGRFVNREAVDLLVLSPKSDPSSSNSLDPGTDRVLRRVTCPVLLVRSPHNSRSSGPETAK